MTMICPSCESNNASSAVYCLRCGASLEGAHESIDPGELTDGLPPVLEDTPAQLVSEAAARLAEGHSTDAIESCQRALALNPGLIEAYAVLGMAYEREGQLEDALAAYETVVELDPQRLAEQQKASLLRLRVQGEPSPAPPTLPWWGEIWQRMQSNLPLTVAVATGVFVFLIGSIVLVTSARAGARRQAHEQYRQAIYSGDQAMAQQNYRQAAACYQQAWDLQPGEELVRTRWEQAYRLANTPPSAEQWAAQMPKYIPSSGPNPFSPVIIGGRDKVGTAVPPEQAGLTTESTQAATQTPTAGLSALRGQGNRDLPPPTTPSGTAPPGATSPAGSSGRRTLPEGPATTPNKNPLTPVPPRPASGETKTEPAAPTTETASRGSKGEITIWVSDTPRSPATPSRPASPDPDSVRARADSLAAEGRRTEAISQYERARGLYEDRGRQDPSRASASQRAADTCNARIEVLRASQ
jgi:tetratricopeptide (TPR) repeat protein